MAKLSSGRRSLLLNRLNSGNLGLELALTGLGLSICELESLSSLTLEWLDVWDIALSREPSLETRVLELLIENWAPNLGDESKVESDFLLTGNSKAILTCELVLSDFFADENLGASHSQHGALVWLRFVALFCILFTFFGAVSLLG